MFITKNKLRTIIQEELENVVDDLQNIWKMLGAKDKAAFASNVKKVKNTIQRKRTSSSRNKCPEGEEQVGTLEGGEVVCWPIGWEPPEPKKLTQRQLNMPRTSTKKSKTVAHKPAPEELPINIDGDEDSALWTVLTHKGQNASKEENARNIQIFKKVFGDGDYDEEDIALVNKLLDSPEFAWTKKARYNPRRKWAVKMLRQGGKK